MDQGDSPTFEYLLTNGHRCLARLLPTDIHGPLNTTDDPLWVLRDVDTGTEVSAEWITYRTHDNTDWRSKTHCSYTVVTVGPAPGELIGCWFEHERTNGQDNRNNSSERDIAFLAWDGTRWVARVNAVRRPFPGV